ncbi:HAD family hydrolase [Streptomyces antarcticus]|uniref:HAD family hydrolase n=1 Tax=Streptomyces antarcticus TaxID=2996458 RepID=UPI00226EB4A5|nr:MULTISPECIES: HAD-IA family hydrolase [unclassified Streptomyces]MCY0939826.1 HAD-IA family hydrolase [Streptomyces sp. H34-AA3]MCY0949923.1 HAD-IA family hydrolase [Streptomyces sp. H27-S2]MCZ4080996.1 HAD-IA family hydrolase [Streptomyces sp. H34-S5]
MSALRAVVFDTDGVLLDSARLHAAAWKTAFDSCLDAWASSGKGRQPPFDADREYRQWVDGKPRLDGAASFLNARGIDLPTGSPDSAPGADTVWAVAARKESEFVRTLEAGTVEAFADVAPALARLRAHGVGRAAVSASRHARPLLGSASLLGFFDVVVDGTDAARLGLAGKPDPSLFLEAAARLGVEPARCVVVEDALAGVEAGRRGHFGLVVGLDRTTSPTTARALRDRGAGLVAAELLAVADTVSGAGP